MQTDIITLANIPQKDILPGCKMRAIHGESMTVTYWNLEKGAAIPEHSHPHEQIGSVIEGEIEVTLNGELRRLRKGDVLVFASDSRHSVVVLENSYVIDVFHPVRDDYR